MPESKVACWTAIAKSRLRVLVAVLRRWAAALLDRCKARLAALFARRRSPGGQASHPPVPINFRCKGSCRWIRIKVLRNDLSDADLEVVQAKTPTTGGRAGQAGGGEAGGCGKRVGPGDGADRWRQQDLSGRGPMKGARIHAQTGDGGGSAGRAEAAAGGRYADGTIGGAGHAAAILAASSPTGWLFGCDRDGAAVEAARARLAEFAGRFEIRQGNFAELAEWVPAGSCDGVLLDLGVSSPQLDEAERGFSFQQDGPLDMRMDRRQELTAARPGERGERGRAGEDFLGTGRRAGCAAVCAGDRAGARTPPV